MSQAHKGSRLVAIGQLKSIHPDTVFLAHYDITANDVLTGISPSLDSRFTLKRNEGKFGGGVLIEEDTTNLVANGSFTKKIFQGPYGGTTYNGNLSFVDMVAPVSSVALKHEAIGEDSCTNPYTGEISSLSPASEGQSWTASVYVKADKPDTSVQLYLFPLNSEYMYLSAPSIAIRAGLEWERISVSAVMPSGTVGISTRVDNDAGSGNTVYWNGWQLEQKWLPTTFVDGARSGRGRLRYPDKLLNHKEGTLSFWYQPMIPWGENDLENGTGEPLVENLFVWGDPGNNNTIWGRRDRRSDEIYFYYNNAPLNTGSLNLTGNAPVMVSFTWKDGEQKLFFNGEMKSTTFQPSIERPDKDYFDVGGRNDDAGYCTCLGIIDELRIDKSARTEEEILSWYLSGAPFYPRGIYTIAY